MNSSFPLLSVLTFLPIVGGCAVLAVGSERGSAAKVLSLLVSLATLILSVPLFTQFDTASAAMQFVENKPWIEAFSINYHLGVDGISVPLILLTTFITVLVVIAGWEVIEVSGEGW